MQTNDSETMSNLAKLIFLGLNCTPDMQCYPVLSTFTAQHDHGVL